MARLPIWLTRVQSDSMLPGLRDGQLVCTVAVPRWIRLPRGAVVAVDSRELDRRIVKRVIGLPGEHLELGGGRTTVDGRSILEPYATTSTGPRSFDVPPGHYLLLGDNRAASSDARHWRRPFVTRREIIGVLATRPRRLASRRRSPAGTPDVPTGRGRIR